MSPSYQEVLDCIGVIIIIDFRGLILLLFINRLRCWHEMKMQIDIIQIE